MSKQREALQVALEALEDYQANGAPFFKCDSAVSAIREALAEPEQEPVAWMLMNDTQCHIMATDWKPEDSDGWKTAPLYTAPPARKPLTDSEVFNMAADYYEGYGFKAAEFARAIERAHGIGSD